MIDIFRLKSAEIISADLLLHMKGEKNFILRGAVSIGAGTFVAKFLGALYRVPLTNLIGSFGLGLYQMVFPVYALLLDFSGAGVPSAISKIISGYDGADKRDYAYSYLKSSIRLFALFGFLGSCFLAIFAKLIAILQGNPEAYLGYLFLAPAVFFVSIISCFRGYFQGLMKMSPTAKSQITEQVIKLVFGIGLVYLFMPNVPLAVAGATFAITISEIVALLQLYLIYKKDKAKFGLHFQFNKSRFKFQSKHVIKTAVPITLIGIMIPLSHVIDSFLTVNILSGYRSDATSLYGLMSGVVHTLINLPVSICYGFATVAVPAVSSAKTEREKTQNALKTIGFTVLLALPCAIMLAILAPNAINILFGKLSHEHKFVATNLLRLTSPAVVLLSLLQTENAVLIGKGKLYFPIISLSFGIFIKTALSVVLLKTPQLNIYGGGIALIACYFIVCLINLIMIFKSKVKNASKQSFNREYAR